MSVEAYNVTTDFTSYTGNPLRVNLGALQDEINADGIITTNCNEIDAVDEDVSIQFDSDLSAPEKTQLNVLVAAFDNPVEA